MRMAQNLSSKAESVRLQEPEQVWLDSWTKKTVQDRSAVLRAGLRMLRLVLDGMEFSAAVSLIATLSGDGDDQRSKDELWAALAVRAMGSAEPPAQSKST